MPVRYLIGASVPVIAALAKGATMGFGTFFTLSLLAQIGLIGIPIWFSNPIGIAVMSVIIFTAVCVVLVSLTKEGKAFKEWATGKKAKPEEQTAGQGESEQAEPLLGDQLQESDQATITHTPTPGEPVATTAFAPLPDAETTAAVIKAMVEDLPAPPPPAAPVLAGRTTPGGPSVPPSPPSLTRGRTPGERSASPSLAKPSAKPPTVLAKPTPPTTTFEDVGGAPGAGREVLIHSDQLPPLPPNGSGESAAPVASFSAGETESYDFQILRALMESVPPKALGGPPSSPQQLRRQQPPSTIEQSAAEQSAAINLLAQSLMAQMRDPPPPHVRQ
jgi:hypothetical protein